MPSGTPRMPASRAVVTAWTELQQLATLFEPWEQSGPVLATILAGEAPAKVKAVATVRNAESFILEGEEDVFEVKRGRWVCG